MAVRINRHVKPWAQMTYTSADSPDASRRGGWGVKETTPDLTPVVVDRLMSGASTRLDAVPALSSFPSDKELEARPRRLAYRLVEGRVTLWHAVEAGPDGSGRPGNVFVHIAAEVAQGTATRPIEYWRSANWLVPFGTQEVSKARIPPSLTPDHAINREACLDFILTGDVPRLFVLPWLLDAVTEAVTKSISAVLVTETADEAAGWIAAFSYLTAPQLAQQISFVTFERAHTLSFAMQQGFQVICVPREDSERLAQMQGPFLLLDPQWDLDERAAAERGVWNLPTGRSLPVTRWQAWVLDLASMDREHALAVLKSTDEVGSQLSSGADVPLYWPLSVAMMLDENCVITRRGQKIQEILGATPADLLYLPAYTLLLDELVTTLDAEGWREFVAGNRDKATLQEVATARRLVAALRQPAGIAPTMEVGAVALRDRTKAELRHPVLEAVTRAGELSAGGADEVIAAARIASLLLDFGLQPVPENDADIPPLERVMDRLQLRLRAPDLASRQDEIARLHPLLTGEQGRRRPVPEPAQVATNGSVPEAASGGRYLGSVRSPVQVGRGGRVDVSAQWAVRDRICQDLSQLLDEVPAGTTEGAVLGRAVCLAAGLPPGALPTIEELAERPFLARACANILVGPKKSPKLLLEHSKQIVALLGDSSALVSQPDLLGKLQTELTSLAVLQCLDQDFLRTEPITAATVAPFITAAEEVHIEALVHLFEPGTGPDSGTGSGPETDVLGWAARLIVASAGAATVGVRSVLTIPTRGGEGLGWVVSRRLVTSLAFPRARLEAEIVKRAAAIANDDMRTRAEKQIGKLLVGPDA